MSTGNIRGQRTQSSTGGFKTLASSIASGNNGGAFKRIYINAYQRYNGNSDLALSSTLGINKGSYLNATPSSTPLGKDGPTLGQRKGWTVISNWGNAVTVQSGVMGTNYATHCNPPNCCFDGIYIC
jgi:hypothetical protein